MASLRKFIADNSIMKSTLKFYLFFQPTCDFACQVLKAFHVYGQFCTSAFKLFTHFGLTDMRFRGFSDITRPFTIAVTLNVDVFSVLWINTKHKLMSILNYSEGTTIAISVGIERLRLRGIVCERRKHRMIQSLLEHWNVWAKRWRFG